MIFNLKNEYEKEQFKEYVNKLYKEGEVVEVKKKHPGRSLSQNNYLHLILSYFACEYGCSVDEAKLDYYKRTCNREIFEATKTNRRGREIKVMRSSSDLTTEEMSLSIDRFRNWSAANGIYLPSPGEDQFLLFIRQEIERNKEFL